MNAALFTVHLTPYTVSGSLEKAGNLIVLLVECFPPAAADQLFNQLLNLLRSRNQVQGLHEEVYHV